MVEIDFLLYSISAILNIIFLVILIAKAMRKEKGSALKKLKKALEVIDKFQGLGRIADFSKQLLERVFSDKFTDAQMSQVMALVDRLTKTGG